MYKRDFSAPTLEDHFNKTILPKVMQVGSASVLRLRFSVIRSSRAVNVIILDWNTSGFSLGAV